MEKKPKKSYVLPTQEDKKGVNNQNPGNEKDVISMLGKKIT